MRTSSIVLSSAAVAIPFQLGTAAVVNTPDMWFTTVSLVCMCSALIISQLTIRNLSDDL